VREADGLALSSRNQQLDAAERPLAPALYRALVEAASCVDAGLTDTALIRDRAGALIPKDERVRLEYLEVVTPDVFQPVPRVTGPVIIAGALWVGRTRLIDNVTKERR
jgi:pantoate--beta-alanine ligase